MKTEKKVLMIISPENFRDEELLDPKKVFEDNNIKVTIASRGIDTAKGKLGVTVGVDIDIADVNVDNYNAIIFVGGPGASIYFDDSTALSIAKGAYSKGKIIAAICIAPSILANAGILAGRKATCFQSEAENLKSRGASYTGEPVTIDGKIVTASGPYAATSFGQEIVKLLLN